MDLHNNSEIEENASSSIVSAKFNLNLANITLPDIPKEIVFPDELNRFLRNQVEVLTHENGMLRKNLTENELKLTESVRKSQTLVCQLQKYQNNVQPPALEFIPDSNEYLNAINGRKVIELSKKVRELNSEMQVYKSKCSKLEQHILESKRQATNPEIVEIVQSSSNDDQTKKLKDSLYAANGKLCELRNINSTLKADLKLANKILHQELGQQFQSIHTLSRATNWRGRTQLICDLQQKLHELKEKLKLTEQQNSGKVNSSHETLQIQLQSKLATLETDNYKLQQTLQATKQKLEHLKAKMRAVESESYVLRAKLDTSSEQNENYQKAITTLNNEILSVKQDHKEQFRQRQHTIQQLEQENRKLQLNAAQELCKLENLEKRLQLQTEELINVKSTLKDNSSKCSINGGDSRLLTEQVKRLETERLRLLELTEIANNRLEAERNGNAQVLSKYQRERKKVAKLEAQLARLKLKQSSDKCNSIYSCCSDKSNDFENPIRDQLELAKETIKTLETKLQLEQQERKIDFQQFRNILQNYTN